MIKTLEKTGRTEDDAINAALAELGLDRDDEQFPYKKASLIFADPQPPFLPTVSDL